MDRLAFMEKEVSELERRLTGPDGGQQLNDIAKLYEIAESEDLRTVAEALKAIPRVLAHHRRRCRDAAAAASAAGTAGGGEGEASGARKDGELLAWLRGHADAYHSALAQLAVSTKPRAQVCAVRLVIGALQDEADEAHLGAAGRGASAQAAAASPAPADQRLTALITEVLLAENWSGRAAECLMGEFAVRYVDVRHYTLHHLRACAEQAGNAGMVASGGAKDVAPPVAKRRRQLGPFAAAMRERGLSCEELFARTLAFLREAPSPPEGTAAAAADAAEEKDAQTLASGGRPARFYLREYRKLFQNAWLQLLSLRAPLKQCKPLLQLLPALVVPHMTNPLMLADFYIQAFHSGSPELSVLSLSGLFLLITRYGLGDPDALSSSCGEYYARLYSLLSSETLKLQRRARFQRLLATSLASGLLPARLAGAFAKKCMRLAVACSDHGTVMWLMAISYTLIQKHHSHCSNLLHRRERDGDQAEDNMPTEQAQDVAPIVASDAFETDAPLPTAVEQAAKTSLWELQLLRKHHVSAVATLAKLFLKPFFKPTAKKLDPEDFLDQSASKLYTQALRSGERQLERLKTKGQQCPLAFKIEDDDIAIRITGWAATLSTSQRQLGAGV